MITMPIAPIIKLKIIINQPTSLPKITIKTPNKIFVEVNAIYKKDNIFVAFL